MCYDSNAKPPFPPERRGAASGEDIVLTAGDGNRFNAYAARPDSPTGAQVIIFPDVRGLHQFYKDLAIQFAETGTAALAIDYFGRTAGLTARDDAFEFWPHVQQMQAAHFSADVAAAAEYARAQLGCQIPTFTLGFCMGGALSLQAAAEGFDLAGAVAFYPALSRAIGGYTPVLERAEAIRLPVLCLFGGADQGIPAAEVEQLEATFARTGVEHEIQVYPGAPHSFFDRKQSEFADASADSWRRILRFFQSHTPVTA